MTDDRVIAAWSLVVAATAGAIGLTLDGALSVPFLSVAALHLLAAMALVWD